MEATSSASDRVERFHAEIDEIARRATPPSRERVFLVLGEILMFAGIAVALGSWIMAGNQSSGDLAIDNLEHNELTILALTGVAMSIAGAAVYLRYGLSKFLRLWLLRQLAENKSNLQTIERLLDR